MNDLLQCQVIDYWFGDEQQSDESFDRRLARWFSDDANFNFDIERRFGKLVSVAYKGGLDNWLQTPQGSVALTLLLGVFPRYLFTDIQQLQVHIEKAVTVIQSLIEKRQLTDLPFIQQAVVLLPLKYSQNHPALAQQQYTELRERGDKQQQNNQWSLIIKHFL